MIEARLEAAPGDESMLESNRDLESNALTGGEVTDGKIGKKGESPEPVESGCVSRAKPPEKGQFCA